jgi:hypothetical protein
MMRRAVVVAAAVLAAGQGAAAQQELRQQCAGAGHPQTQALCENVADAIVIAQPRVVIGHGGNPVPGTASTLGMRLGSMPRVGLGLRVSAAEVKLPPVERLTAAQDVQFPLGSINADVTVGVFQGFAVLPTVGGFGSVDLIGSAGIMPLPRGEGFDDSSPVSWAAGARIGLLRESFTAPGVSVDVMYRSLGTVAYGSERLTDRDAFFRISDFSATQVRATVGKRLLGFGVSGGAAWDRYSADVAARIRDPRLDPLNPETRAIEIRQDDMSGSRTAVFGNASFTFIIMSLVTELGWQRGGPAIEGASGRIERGAWFGGVSLRLTI